MQMHIIAVAYYIIPSGKIILEPLHFGAFLLSKKGIKNCIQAKPTISQAQLSACFLCSHASPLFLFHPISKLSQLTQIDPDCHFREISGLSV